MNPYIGEIKIFAGNFAPRNCALCNDRILSIMRNPALFSILGTTYGGNGTTTFALPDLRGRSPMHAGSGPGLTARPLGEIGGAEMTTLTGSQIPAHTHTLNAFTNAPTTSDPTNALPGKIRTGNFYGTPGNQQTMALSSIDVTGGQPHSNLQPYLAVTFIITLIGVLPTSN